MKAVLTPTDNPAYNTHTSKIWGEDMKKGSVKPKSHCKCGDKFKKYQEKRKEWYQCPTCDRVPDRFIVIAIFALGRKHGRLTSDPRHPSKKPEERILDTYSKAIDLLSDIYAAWKGEDFNPNDWIADKVVEKQIKNLYEDYEKELDESLKAGDKVSETVIGIKRRFRLFILPKFGNRSIDDFEADSKNRAKEIYSELNKWKLELLQQYSHSYVKNTINDFKAFLSSHLWGSTPKFPKVKKILKNEKQVLDMERERLIAAELQECYKLPIEIMLSGESLRNGEIRALKIHDVIPYHYISVTKSSSRNQRKSGGRVTKRLPAHLWDRLLNHCKGKQPDDYIFTTPTGQQLYDSALYKAWKRAWKKANRKKPIKYIDLRMATRHSNATDIISDAMEEAFRKAGKALGDNPQTVKQNYYVNTPESTPGVHQREND